MNQICVACVWTKGHKPYTAKDVIRLKRMVDFWSPPHLDVKFICLTDRPHELPNINTIDIRFAKLSSWWGKMVLFELSWRSCMRVVYYDLDTVLIGSQEPLLTWDGCFGICESFTKEVHAKHWPCAYGSCVMSIAPNWGESIWTRFRAEQARIIKDCRQYGDQMAIEKLHPTASLLQYEMPKGFFMGYRNLKNHPTNQPENTAVVIYAGKRSPSNFGPPWIRKYWNSY